MWQCHIVPFSPFSSATIVSTQTNRQSAVFFPQMNCLAWEPEVSALIFLPPCHISMTTDIEITLCPGRGKKRLGDTTQWYFCGTWGEQGSFRQASQGWVFNPLKRKDQRGQREEAEETKELQCGSSHLILKPDRRTWHSFVSKNREQVNQKVKHVWESLNENKILSFTYLLFFDPENCFN